MGWAETGASDQAQAAIVRLHALDREGWPTSVGLCSAITPRICEGSLFFRRVEHAARRIYTGRLLLAGLMLLKQQSGGSNTGGILCLLGRLGYWPVVFTGKRDIVWFIYLFVVDAHHAFCDNATTKLIASLLWTAQKKRRMPG